jgi:hypothetical protein
MRNESLFVCAVSETTRVLPRENRNPLMIPDGTERVR